MGDKKGPPRGRSVGSVDTEITTDSVNLGSVAGRGGGAQAGLRPDELVVEGGALTLGAGAAVHPGDHDDDQEGQRHGEQRRMVVG